jgi:hypothetical protein
MIMMKKIINYFLRKLGLHIVKFPVLITDEMRINIYAEHISRTALKHATTGLPIEMVDPDFVYAGEVNWDTWQARINDKILEKDLRSDKEHLGDQ